MYINGKWLTEPEIEVRFKQLEKENGELKRLLKTAVGDINDLIFHCFGMAGCYHCKHLKDNCYEGVNCEHEAIWEHADEALKLIGGNENGN